MKTSLDISSITPISKKEAKKATLESLQKMLEVLFYFFEDEDGNYIAKVKPLEDFKKFMCEEDYGDESQTFLEDMCENDDEPLIGMHEKHLII